MFRRTSCRFPLHKCRFWLPDGFRWHVCKVLQLMLRSAFTRLAQIFSCVMIHYMLTKTSKIFTHKVTTFRNFFAASKRLPDMTQWVGCSGCGMLLRRMISAPGCFSFKCRPQEPATRKRGSSIQIGQQYSPCFDWSAFSASLVYSNSPTFSSSSTSPTSPTSSASSASFGSFNFFFYLYLRCRCRNTGWNGWSWGRSPSCIHRGRWQRRDFVMDIGHPHIQIFDSWWIINYCNNSQTSNTASLLIDVTVHNCQTLIMECVSCYPSKLFTVATIELYERVALWYQNFSAFWFPQSS